MMYRVIVLNNDGTMGHTTVENPDCGILCRRVEKKEIKSFTITSA